MAQPARSRNVTKIIIPNYQPGTGDFYFYMKTLLGLALAQTDGAYGPVLLVSEQEILTQELEFENMTQGLTDINWSVTTIKREQQHIALRIPLTAGLFGYRVLLVRDSDSRFNGPLILPDLKKLTAVQGIGWPDNSILIYNGFSMITDNYADTFDRLADGSADYYPRAAHEVFEELEARPDKGFSIAKRIVLQYKNPMFFFVAKDKPVLAKRLLKGLQKLVANGDLNRLLTSQHFYIRARNLLDGRTLYRIENPLLSNATNHALANYHSPLDHLF